MGLFESGDQTGPQVHLRRSARARRMSLRVSAIDGRVTLTVPKHAPLRAARAFLAEQEDWIARAVAGVAVPVDVGVGCSVPVEGVPREVVAGDVRAARLEADRIIVGTTLPGVRIEACLKALARVRLSAAVDDYAARIGAEAGRITLRDPRSRWGSCSSRGDLMFSWRLVMAPPDVLRYVAAHEVAHLRHIDHSAVFWRLTAQLFPDHTRARAWLREKGPSLHRYRFRGGAR